MAIINAKCSVTKCTERLDERSLNSGGIHFLVTRWAAAVRAGTCTKCLPHYLDTDIPTVYAAYVKGAAPRRNRELG
jgi:hypothetical protein